MALPGKVPNLESEKHVQIGPKGTWCACHEAASRHILSPSRIASEKDIASGKRKLDDHELSSGHVAKRQKKALALERKMKKRTLKSSREAPDMSLVTLENFNQKKVHSFNLNMYIDMNKFAGMECHV